MLLAHIIEQLQEAHAKLGNHPNARLVVDSHFAPGVVEQPDQESYVYLDSAKQTVHLPVTLLDHTP